MQALSLRDEAARKNRCICTIIYSRVEFFSMNFVVEFQLSSLPHPHTHTFSLPFFSHSLSLSHTPHFHSLSLTHTHTFLPPPPPPFLSLTHFLSLLKRRTKTSSQIQPSILTLLHGLPSSRHHNRHNYPMIRDLGCHLQQSSVWLIQSFLWEREPNLVATTKNSPHPLNFLLTL